MANLMRETEAPSEMPAVWEPFRVMRHEPAREDSSALVAAV